MRWELERATEREEGKRREKSVWERQVMLFLMAGGGVVSLPSSVSIPLDHVRC